jgi:hypothetical protein
MGTKPKQSGTRHCGLRFPAFITLAPSVTRCSRCPGQPLILAAVIDGLERRLDPLPLSVAGLQAAVASRRYVAVVRPFAEPLAHRAQPGHWWLTTPYGTGPAPLLVEHAHGLDPLPHDPSLATALLARFLPAAVQDTDPDAPPPF